ncbi:MAG: 2-amino-4-hydroxy-6-hydroxymethyldihydropteridine diphosphokinase [Elusimicrobia bacterium]|nr:2-amino-4-hydroxy-6-hydroxymethyldihydropteridine diphosphokinase [Elusimicrobiota bacterium]
MTPVWLSLGSNRAGPRRKLAWALRELARLPRTRLVRATAPVATAPIGPAQPRFLNLCALVRTRLTPMGLLTECKRLEALAGRRPGRRWGPRPLDIDIVLYGMERIRRRWLTVPHPQAVRRDFVLRGLRELKAPVRNGILPSPARRSRPHG